MWCSAGFSFASSFSWPEMLERLRRVGSWDEWWHVDAGDTLLSINSSNQYREKLTIHWDVAIERWILDARFECEGTDATERWSVFSWRLVETLTVIDAAAIEKFFVTSSEGASAWMAFDYQMGFAPV